MMVTIDFFFYLKELVFMGDWWAGSKIVLYMNKNDYEKYWGKEHSYCIMNHTYEIDWLIGWMICDRIHLLGVCIYIYTCLNQLHLVLKYISDYS